MVETTGDSDQSASSPLAKAGVSQPVEQPNRIAALDVLRGVALLGILVMNIQAFAMILPAYFNPYAYGDMTGANYVVWLLCHVLADRKFMTIFSILFGAGVVLMTQRREAASGRSAGIHYRRMAVLLVLGLIHAYLIWDGDILVTYAICGMVVYPLRRRRPKTLLITGLILIAFASAITQFFQWSMPQWSKEDVQGLNDDVWQPTPEQIDSIMQQHRGDWLGLLPARAESALLVQTFLLLAENLWRVCGLMLWGMALFKLGWLSGQRSRSAYAILMATGLLIGLPLIIAGVHYRDSVDWNVRQAFFMGGQFNYWGSLPVAMAWIGGVMLACKASASGVLTKSLSAVGQMAFTNYLLQSVICTLLFNGYGFGWFGSVDRVGQFGIVLGVWAFQLILSPLWLARFRFGPAEWLWRALTYGIRPPLRR